MYIGIGPNDGIEMHDDEAFGHMIDELLSGDDDLKKEAVEWYYSGNWIHEEDKEDA